MRKIMIETWMIVSAIAITLSVSVNERTHRHH